MKSYVRFFFPLVLDQNKDGKISVEELEKYAESIEELEGFGEVKDEKSKNEQ